MTTLLEQKQIDSVNKDPGSNENAEISSPKMLDEYWTAVQKKDQDYDGEFVFAVATTGIYCRPSCPSKTAKRQNVRFYETTFAAQSAGFRACKRCHPEGVSQQHTRNALIEQACEHMQNSASRLSLDELAHKVGMSPHHFHRVFKSIVGVTPKDYQQAILQKRMVNALDKSQSITEAIYDAGFNSAGRFYEGADAMLGMTAQSYRKEGSGVEIRYAVEPCALGVILVAATPRGVCAIEFGSSAHELVERLRGRFAQASFSPADETFRNWIGKILAYIEHPKTLLDMPLDVQGTVFQRRVWKALQDIPVGQTLSYTEVAEKIGQPSAARAVASACASNQIAVVIPCHRVVRSDGSLSGYRWGVERKAELLRREKNEN
jgi:AraC family transcriptional regulator, regulatory protein of adaptative response / methylated-DNA-[protein]-cysteine methyltransferase